MVYVHAGAEGSAPDHVTGRLGTEDFGSSAARILVSGVIKAP